MEGWSSTNYSCLFRDLTPCVTTKDFHSVKKACKYSQIMSDIGYMYLPSCLYFGETPEPLWYYSNTVLY